MSIERLDGRGNTPSEKLEYNFEEAFKNSSLSRTVLGIEIGKAAKQFTSQRAPSPILIGEQITPEDKIPLEVIKQNPDFQKLKADLSKIGEGLNEEDGRQLFDSLEGYGKFLSSDAHIRGKLFAAEHGFQDYIRKTPENAPLGPYFRRALRELKSGNPEIIDFVGNRFDPRKLDKVYLQLKEYAVVTSKPLSEFQEVTGDVLDTAFDVEDTSKLRKFILQFPIAAFEPVLCIDANYIGVDRDNLIDNYNPNFQYERLKRLVDSVDEENFSFLCEYMLLTMPGQSLKTGEVLDKEILAGKLDRAKTVSTFRETIYKDYDRDNKVEVIGRNQFGPFYAETFVDNQITEEQLFTIASNFRDLRSSILTLPEKIASSMSFDQIEDDKYHHYAVAELVQDPDFCSDGETIVKLVAAGIDPTKKLRGLIKGQGEDLEEIVQFGKSLISPRVEDDFFVYEDIIQDWIFKYLGTTSDKKFSLQELAKNLKDVKQAADGFYQLINASHKHKTLIESFMEDFYSSDAMLEEPSSLAILLNNGILPTENIMQYMKENGDVGIDNLLKMREETVKGRLDSQNNVQKDLEFVKYLSLGAIGAGNIRSITEAYDRFKKIDFLEEKKETNPVLNPTERMESEAAAFEAANLFHFIKERKDLGRKVAAIGNQRYGAYFVIEALRYYLEKEEIPVSIHYVRSGQNTEADLTRTFNVITAYLDRNNFDDIVVVDGTTNAFSGDTPRLPRALAIYAANLVKEGYHISHWTPIKGEEIVVGDKKEIYCSPSDQKPQVILANPVIDPKRFAGLPRHLSDHRMGYLDDPEKFGFQKTEIAFTKKGLETLRSGRTQEEFVALVQSHMGYVMDNVIRRANKF